MMKSLGMVTIARESRQRGRVRKGPAARPGPPPEIIGALRECLRIDGSVGDAVIAACLMEIARFDEWHSRWQAALDSTLGHWLALNGADMAIALDILVMAAPQPQA